MCFLWAFGKVIYARHVKVAYSARAGDWSFFIRKFDSDVFKYFISSKFEPISPCAFFGHLARSSMLDILRWRIRVDSFRVR